MSLQFIRHVLVAVIIAASGFALTPVVKAGPWQSKSLIAIGSLMVVVGIVRYFYLRRTPPRFPLGALFVPSLVGMLAAVLYVVGLWNVGSVATSGTSAIPGWGWLESRIDAIGSVASSIPTEINEGFIPLDATPAMVLLVVAGLSFVYLFADALTVGLGQIWGVFGLAMALWVTPLILLEEAPIIPLVISGIALVILLFLPKDIAPGQRLASRLSGAVAAGAGIVALSLVGATALTMNAEPRGLPFLALNDAEPSSIQLATEFDVGNDLGEQSTALAFTYTDTAPSKATSESQNQPMRLHTLTNFDGGRWSEVRPVGDALEPATAFARGVSDPTVESRFERRISLDGLSDANVPNTISPARETSAEGLLRNPTYDELELPQGSTAREYTLLVSAETPTAKALRAVGTTESAQYETSLSEVYLKVPTSPFQENIRNLAWEVVAKETTQFDQLAALQAYLRDSGKFTYSHSVKPTTNGDPIWSFLESRNGYCVQFATSMLVMARNLGIPGRMGVGFLPGNSVDGAVRVTAKEAHTWPEFYFDGIGWVRFEPTPSAQTGPAPAWTLDGDTASPKPTATPTPTQKPTVTPKPTPSASRTVGPNASGTSSPRPGANGTSVIPAIGVVSGAVVLFGLVLLTVFVRRRRRSHDVEQAWAIVVTAARRAGVPGSAALTPQAWGEAIAAELSTRIGGGDGAVLEALEGLVTSVETTRYQDTAAPPPLAVTTGWARVLVEALKAKHV